jgi:Protease subunit of ATP-dependent Clp proteases
VLAKIKEVKKEMSVLVPYVIEQVAGGERTYDIFSRLLKDRIIFVDKEINDVSADIVVAELLFLESQSSDKDISLYINSPGGSVTAGLAIYDTMQHIRPDIQTICLGQCASMAAILLAGGTKGKRFALPSSRVMIHQPWGGVTGQATDINIQAKEILRLKNMVISYFAKDTNRTEEEVKKDMERDFFMSSEQAKQYGIVDIVMVGKKNENK